MGLEPTTNALKGRCSTIELPTRNPEYQTPETIRSDPVFVFRKQLGCAHVFFAPQKSGEKRSDHVFTVAMGKHTTGGQTSRQENSRQKIPDRKHGRGACLISAGNGGTDEMGCFAALRYQLTRSLPLISRAASGSLPSGCPRRLGVLPAPNARLCLRHEALSRGFSPFRDIPDKAGCRVEERRMRFLLLHLSEMRERQVFGKHLLFEGTSNRRNLFQMESPASDASRPALQPLHRFPRLWCRTVYPRICAPSAPASQRLLTGEVSRITEEIMAFFLGGFHSKVPLRLSRGFARSRLLPAAQAIPLRRAKQQRSSSRIRTSWRRIPLPVREAKS